MNFLCLPPWGLSAKIHDMKLFALRSLVVLCAAMIWTTASAQVSSSDRSDSGRIDELTRKIDVQNAKIDTLSRQILKLEQQISALRPGVMIGEATPSATAGEAKPPQTGNSHVVAKGET